MYRRSFIVLCACIESVAPARASDLTVLVSEKASSLPVTDAVIEVRGGADDLLPFTPVTRRIDQRDETFIPYVEIFRPGDRVEFHNGDDTRHHVYSFASAKSFEFVIAPGDSAPAITLDRPGEIDVGCNIHDHMIAHLLITDAAHVAKTGRGGQVVFTGLADGRYSVQVWHPQLRPGKDLPEQTMLVDARGASLEFRLSLLPDPRAGAGDPERNGY